MREAAIGRTRPALIAACVLAAGWTAPTLAQAQNPPPSTAFRAADYADYFSAQLALEDGDYAIAADRFYALSERHPAETAWAEAALAARLASGDPVAALTLARELRRNAQTLAPLPRLVLAADALHERDWEEAAAYLEPLEDDGAADATKRLAAGLMQVWAAAGDGDEDRALELLLRLPRPRAAAAALPFQRAMILEHARRFEEAAAAYTEAAAGQRLLVEDVLRYAAFHERRGEEGQAQAYLDRMSARVGNVALEAARRGDYRPASPNPVRNAALGLIGYGRGLAAEDAAFDAALVLSLALIVDPEQDGGRLALALQLRAMGQRDRAEAVAAVIGPASAYYEAAQVEIAEIWAETGRPQESLALIRTVAAETGGRFALRAYADLALTADAPAEAEAAFTQLIALEDPTAPQWRPRFGRGQARALLGRWSEAESDYRAALALDAEEAVVLTALAQGLLDHGGSVDEALGLMEAAYRFDPRNADVLAGLGEAYLAAGRGADAVVALEQALQRRLGSPRIAERLGDALWETGRRREARYHWTRALVRETDPARRATLEHKLETGLAQTP